MTDEQTYAIAASVGWHKGRGGAINAGAGYETPSYWYDSGGHIQHPCVTDAFANLTAWRPVWRDPRPVDVWLWMDLEVFDAVGNMVRYGRVSWNADGTGPFDVSISFEREGVGLPCWPSFRVLSDAQEFVEYVMQLSLDEARRIHGTQWPGVVL